jgi:hypothetical protein
MSRSLIRNFALISILFIVAGCSPVPYSGLQTATGRTSCFGKLRPQFTSVIYTAAINVTGHHLSGLLILKSMDDSTTRVLFSNEVGVKFFDFEFSKNGFRVVSCVDKMNKKPVINRLRDDLGLLLQHGFDNDQPEMLINGDATYYRFIRNKESVYYITDLECNVLQRIETVSGRKKKILVNLSGNRAGMPDSVYLAHQSFEYNIALKQIEKKNAER